MSAKDPTIARRMLSQEQFRAFAQKMREHGLAVEVPARTCDCGPNDRCPVCIAERGQSVFVREPNEDGE